MTMKLYSYWRSLATLRVRVALNLKGVAYEQVIVDLAAGHQKTPGFKSINPQMVVPALADGDGPILFQSMAILEYLDERFPTPALLPADARGRARVRGLAQICVADTHPLIVPRVRDYLEKDLGLDEAKRLKWIRRWMDAGLTAIEAHLAGDVETGRYSHGDSITLADICLVSQAIGYQVFQGDLATYPAIGKVVARCMEQDAFQRAHPLRQPDAPKPA
jgi:maleylacetoacetate isomerase